MGAGGSKPSTAPASQAAGMNKLPQEVFDIIFANLDLKSLPCRLARYATISRQWQHAVERKLFAELLVEDLHLPVLRRILLDSRRRSFLKVLRYKVTPRTYPSRRRPSGSQAAQVTHGHLTNELTRLWTLLGLFYNQPISEAAPRLWLILGLLLDPKHQDESYKTAWYRQDSARSHVSWTPPPLPGVEKLSIVWGSCRTGTPGFRTAQNCNPSWIFDLLSTCPSIEMFSWNGFEPYIPADGVGINFRDRMSDSLHSASTFDNLQRLYLEFDPPDLDRRGQDVQKCRQAVPDNLNKVLHTLSQRLQTLSLTGLFLLSPDLFWPKSLDDGAEKPLWPHLEDLTIEARLASPEGLFYIDPRIEFPRRPGAGDQIRASDATAGADLVLRASRAMLRMPKLQCLTVRFPEAGGFSDEPGFISYTRLSVWLSLRWDEIDKGECIGECKGFDQPWRWFWGTPCPSEAVRNWDELVGRICRMKRDEFPEW